MKSKLTTKTIPLETKVDDVVLRGELEFSAKDYNVKLIEPFIVQRGYHLQYAVPVTYVYEKSVNPRHHEIELKDLSIEMLKDLYLNKGKNGCKTSK